MNWTPILTLDCNPPGLFVDIMLGLWGRVGTQDAKELGKLEAGYCIDAPELIPAGGCCNYDIDADDSMPEQMTITRGEAPYSLSTSK